MKAPGLNFDLEKLRKAGGDVDIHPETDQDGKWLQKVDDNENAKLIKLVTSWPANKELEDERRQVNANSTNVATATFYGCCCCFYNCCCCCFRIIPFCRPLCGPWCGKDFCLSGRLNCIQVNLRRDRWLWLLHFVCFGIHTYCAVMAYTAGMDSDMLVTIYRVKPSWENRGGGYGYEVVPAKHQFFHIHVVTALFFGFSAFMHSIWVIIGPWRWSTSYMWSRLDDCLCIWRWLECARFLNHHRDVQVC